MKTEQMRDLQEQIREKAEELCNQRFGLAGKIKYGDIYEQGIIAGANFVLSKWQESDRWRTYKDEKPEKGRLVLVYRDIEIKQIYDTIWCDEDELYAEWNNITHWIYIDYPTVTA